METLTARETKALARLESRIEAGLERAERIGLAVCRDLESLRDGQLWRGAAPTFGAYFEARFDMHRRRAYQLIDWARLCTAVHAEIPNERIARELAALPEDLARQLVAQAREQNGGADPTAEQLRALLAGAIREEEEATAGAGPARETRERRSRIERYRALCDRAHKLGKGLVDEDCLEAARCLLQLLGPLVEGLGPRVSLPLDALRAGLEELVAAA